MGGADELGLRFAETQRLDDRGQDRGVDKAADADSRRDRQQAADRGRNRPGFPDRLDWHRGHPSSPPSSTGLAPPDSVSPGGPTSLSPAASSRGANRSRMRPPWAKRPIEAKPANSARHIVHSAYY